MNERWQLFVYISDIINRINGYSSSNMIQYFFCFLDIRYSWSCPFQRPNGNGCPNGAPNLKVEILTSLINENDQFYYSYFVIITMIFYPNWRYNPMIDDSKINLINLLIKLNHPLMNHQLYKRGKKWSIWNILKYI